MLYLVEGGCTKTSSVIYEFHRHENGEKEIKVVKDFKPYFFVDDRAPIEQWDGIVNTEPGYTSIDNTPVKKVTMQQSFLIKDMTSKIKEAGFTCWESDIPYNNRYTIDKAEFKPGKLKVCHFDIETDQEGNKFPDIETANEEITCLTTKIGDVSTTWLCGKTGYEDTRYFEKEEDMLNDFMNFMYKESPDVITAWNLIDFDIKYLINRCVRLGVDYKRLSPLREVKINTFREKTYINIKGLVCFDLLPAYKLWRKYGNLPLLKSYSLDHVAETVLKENKIHHGKTMGYLWRNDLKTLIEYNKWDVELLDMIDKRCKIIDFFNELRIKCCCQFDDVYRTTALIDGFLIKRLNQKVILPTAKKNRTDKFEGAFVFDPIPGLYKNVMCEDIKGMYPNIIKTFNISYETVNGEVKLPTGQTFSKKLGIIPMFLDELAEERAGYKLKLKKATTEADKELWHQRQFGTKIIMNSMYGYLGYVGSRLYKKQVAEAITGMGKYIIQEIIKWVEIDTPCKIIYSDTDSVYVTSTKKDKMEVILQGIEIKDIINQKLIDFTASLTSIENTLEIEFEKALKQILFTEAKKRYAYELLWEEGANFDVDDELHISGFDSKRCITGNTQLILKHNNIINITNASDLEKCNIPQTKIMTENGFKPIKNLFINKIKDIYRLTLSNGSNISCSSNHKFLVKDGNIEKIKELKNIKLTDKIPMSFNQINGPLGNYNIGRFLGLFLAEGSFTPHGITFSFNINEKEYINFISNYSKNVLGIEPSISEYPEKTLTNVMIYGDGIKSYVKQFIKGDSCYTKHLFSKYVSFSYDCKLGIIQGMMEGDGSFQSETYTTTSKKLIKDLSNLCAMCNKPYSIYKPIKHTTYKTIYRLRILKNMNSKYKQHFKTYNNGMWWLNIKSIKKNKDAIRKNGIKMYDIEVDSNTHLFKIANGIVTHNSDCNRVSAITQIKVLEMIMAGKPENDVIAYIRYNHTKMKDRKYTDEEIGFPKGITKELDSYYPPGPIIKGSVYSNKHFNTRFGKGSKPKFVWIKTVKELPETVTMNMVNKQGNRIVKDYKIESAVFDKKIPDNFVIDWDKMSDLTFKSKLINILNAVGWDWQDLNTINLKNFMR